MESALIITISTLCVVLGLSFIYERKICILMLDWLRGSEWKRSKLSHLASGRLVQGNQRL
jgi:hypothetical protein